MGKRIEDLPLDDTPISDPPREPEPHDARDTDWYKFIVEIEDLLATGEVAFASETLEGIQQTVERSHRVTAGQRRAVKNIEATKDRQHASRRYEGFNRW